MEALNIAFRDFLFMLVLILALFVSTDKAKKSEADIQSPGNLMVSITWPEDGNDVDLWIKSPSDKSVGYSRKNGSVFNLVRDDMGTDKDLSGMNYENSFSRGLPDGQYIINLHCYRCTDKTPVPVRVEIRLIDSSGTQNVYSQQLELKKDDEEITAVRFKVKDNRIVSGSQDSIFEPIFGAKE